MVVDQSSRVGRPDIGHPRPATSCATHSLGSVAAMRSCPPANARTRFARLATRSRVFAASNVNAPMSPVPAPVGRSHATLALASVSPLPLVARPQRHRSLRSLGEPRWRAPANVLFQLARRRWRSASLHSAPRCRSACGALRVRPAGGRNVLRPCLRGLVPSPLRLATRPGLRASRPIPGSAALRLPPAPRPPSAPFRSSDRHRLLVCPAHHIRPPQTNSSAARRHRQAPRPASRVLACRRRLAQPATSQAPLAPAAQPARRKLAWPGLMRRWASMLAAPNAARNTERFVRQAHSHPNVNARANANALRSPRTRCARPGAGDGGRGEREGDGTAQASSGLLRVHVPRRLVPSPVHVPRHGLFLSQRLRAAVAQSADMQSVLFFGPRPGIPSARSIHSAELRRITYRVIVRSAAGGSLRAVSVSRARMNVTGGQPPP